MPIPGLTTLALSVTRLAYWLAERKRWLPGGSYHRMSVERLKRGDLEEADRLNRLALRRKPEHGKAQVVRDLIAMRRDAVAASLQKRIDAEQRKIDELQVELLACRRTLAESGKRRRRRYLAGWLLVPAAAGTALAIGAVVTREGLPLWGRVLAGALGVLLAAGLVWLRFAGRQAEVTVRDEECRAALVTLSREIDQRLRRTTDLERELRAAARQPDGLIPGNAR